MAVALTPEQQAVFDGMHSFKERESYLEEVALEAVFKKGISQPSPEPTPEPAPPIAEPVPPVVVEPEPIVPEVKKVEDDVADWKKEAETWKKRKADADKALTPIQQENARLRKEHENASSEIADLKSMFAELNSKLDGFKQPVRPEPDDDFALTYPDVAARIAKAKQEVEGNVDRLVNERLRKIEEDAKQRSASADKDRQEAYRVNHESRVKASHPDVADYFDPNKKAPDLIEWVKTQAPMIAAVANEPLSYPPDDLIFVLNSFKQSQNKTAPKTPSLGDRVQNAKSVPSVAVPTEQSYFTEEEMTDKHIETLLRNARSDPKKMDEIMDKYERTFIHMSK